MTANKKVCAIVKCDFIDVCHMSPHFDGTSTEQISIKSKTSHLTFSAFFLFPCCCFVNGKCWSFITLIFIDFSSRFDVQCSIKSTNKNKIDFTEVLLVKIVQLTCVEFGNKMH